MKTKITSVLVLLAASVFAFAGSESSPAKDGSCSCGKQDVAREQQARGHRAGVDRSPEKRQMPRVIHRGMAKRILLSLNDKQLNSLEKELAAARKMSPEERVEALKSLPRPEMRRNAKPGENHKGAPEAPNPAKFMKHMVLSLDDKQLGVFAKELAAVREMSPEERIEALKSLPAPEMRRRKPDFRGEKGEGVPPQAK